MIARVSSLKYQIAKQNKSWYPELYNVDQYHHQSQNNENMFKLFMRCEPLNILDQCKINKKIMKIEKLIKDNIDSKKRHIMNRKW